MRRGAAALAALLLGALAIEGFSWAALSLQRGGWSTPARRAAERREAVAGAEAAEPGERQRGPRRRVGRREVLHPYVGFVHDPEQPTAFGKRAGPEGFFLDEPPPPGAFVVGVFGGSVAFYLAEHGRAFLVDALHRAPALAGREIAIRDAAYFGYKQPQQLMALAWLETLGERFDVVVNLDGFNEVALPAAENARQRVNPRWPRGWAWRVSALPDPEGLRAIGEVAFLEDRRQERAARLARSGLGWSATAHVLWRALDHVDAARVAALRERLLAPPTGDRRFLTSGAAFDLSDPDAVQRASVEAWRQGSLEMDALCRGLGVPYLHFLQPNQYVAGSKPMGAAERAVAVVERQPYRVPAERGYPALVAAGAELRRSGVRFRDLTQVFASVEEPVYRDGCCHVNAEGNRILAEAIAAAIVESFGAAAPAAAAGAAAPHPADRAPLP